MLISYEKEFMNGRVYVFEYEPDPDELTALIVDLVFERYFVGVPANKAEAVKENLYQLLGDLDEWKSLEEMFESEIASHFESEATDLYFNR